MYFLNLFYKQEKFYFFTDYSLFILVKKILLDQFTHWIYFKMKFQEINVFSESECILFAVVWCISLLNSLRQIDCWWHLEDENCIILKCIFSTVIIVIVVSKWNCSWLPYWYFHTIFKRKYGIGYGKPHNEHGIMWGICVFKLNWVLLIVKKHCFQFALVQYSFRKLKDFLFWFKNLTFYLVCFKVLIWWKLFFGCYT